ncbi:MAG: hypothetical protein GX754_02405 [Clostridiaceae bacterium]|nr:hypothetical protein [Clostridiaceae bacterium]
MLRKLIKYEVKATARWFIPLYTVLLVFALINRLLFYANPSAIEETANVLQVARTLSMLAYVFLFTGIMVVTLVVVVQRYYKGLLGDEGYLMFTLPVQTWKLIMSKLSVAMLWSFLSAIVGICSIMLLIPSPDIRKIGMFFTMIHDFIGPISYFSISLLGLSVLAFSVIEMYAAITLGHLFRKHKLLASFGMYIGLNTLSQMVFILVMPFFLDTIISMRVHSVFPAPSRSNALILVLGITFMLLTATFYAVTNILLKRKLNLE